MRTKVIILSFHIEKNMKIDSLCLGTNFLKQVEKTKFLGINIDEHLNFRYHVEHILKKVSKSIGLLFKLNHFLPKNVLLTLYNTLILPYYNYGIIFWYNSPLENLNRITVTQKKAVRAICQLGFNEHTNGYFKDLNILKIEDLYKMNLCATRLKQIKNPDNNSISHKFVLNSELHPYFTRNRHNYSIPLYSRTSSQSCFLFQASTEFNDLPAHLKECSSAHVFRTKFKRFIIDKY